MWDKTVSVSKLTIADAMAMTRETGEQSVEMKRLDDEMVFLEEQIVKRKAQQTEFRATIHDATKQNDKLKAQVKTLEVIVASRAGQSTREKLRQANRNIRLLQDKVKVLTQTLRDDSALLIKLKRELKSGTTTHREVRKQTHTTQKLSKKQLMEVEENLINLKAEARALSRQLKLRREVWEGDKARFPKGGGDGTDSGKHDPTLMKEATYNTLIDPRNGGGGASNNPLRDKRQVVESEALRETESEGTSGQETPGTRRSAGQSQQASRMGGRKVFYRPQDNKSANDNDNNPFVPSRPVNPSSSGGVTFTPQQERQRRHLLNEKHDGSTSSTSSTSGDGLQTPQQNNKLDMSADVPISAKPVLYTGSNAPKQLLRVATPVLKPVFNALEGAPTTTSAIMSPVRDVRAIMSPVRDVRADVRGATPRLRSAATSNAPRTVKEAPTSPTAAPQQLPQQVTQESVKWETRLLHSRQQQTRRVPTPLGDIAAPVISQYKSVNRSPIGARKSVAIPTQDKTDVHRPADTVCELAAKLGLNVPATRPRTRLAHPPQRVRSKGRSGSTRIGR
jgi:hypothetical protein